MGLGMIEILIVLLVVGGLVFALRRRPTMRKWARRGFIGLLLCCVVIVAAGVGLKWSWQRERIPSNPTDSVSLHQYRGEVGQAIAMSNGGTSGIDGPAIAPKPGHSPTSLPEWITPKPDNPHQIVVVSAQYANKNEAYSDAFNKATNWVLDKFQDTRGRRFDWHPSAANVKNHTIRNQHTQEIIRTAGDHEFTVYRTYLLVDTSPSVMAAFERIMRAQTKKVHRARVVIGAIALTAIMALLAGFFRLDDRTKGRYRLPLVGATFTGIALLTIAVPVLAIRCAEGGHPFCGGPPSDPATIQEAVPREAPRPMSIEPPPPPIAPPPPQANPHRLIEYQNSSH